MGDTAIADNRYNTLLTDIVRFLVILSLAFSRSLDIISYQIFTFPSFMQPMPTPIAE